MLNLKKGLALVLAAATAFTFAPVSTLGLNGVVEAQAADTTTLADWDKASSTSVSKTNTVTIDSTETKAAKTFTLKVTNDDASDPITLKIEGLPTGVTSDTPDSTSVAKSASKTITFTVPANQAESTGDVTVTATKGASDKTYVFGLTINHDTADAEAFADAGKAIAGVDSNVYIQTTAGSSVTLAPSYVTENNREVSANNYKFTVATTAPTTLNSVPSVPVDDLTVQSSNKLNIDSAARGSVKLTVDKANALTAGTTISAWLEAYRLDSTTGKYNLVAYEALTIYPYTASSDLVLSDDYNSGVSVLLGEETSNSIFAGARVFDSITGKQITVAASDFDTANASIAFPDVAIASLDTSTGELKGDRIGSEIATVTIPYTVGGVKSIATKSLRVNVISSASSIIKVTADGSADAALLGTSDAPIRLNVKNNSTFDLSKYVYVSDPANTTIAYKSNNSRNTVSDAGIVTATAAVDQFIVTVQAKDKKTGVVLASTYVYFRVNSLPDDVLAVSGASITTPATVLSDTDYAFTKTKIATLNSTTEETLAASQIHYVQFEVTGNEDPRFEKDLHVTSANGAKLTYSIEQTSASPAFEKISQSGVLTINNTKTSDAAVIKVVSSATANSEVTTSYFYVVIDQAEPAIDSMFESAYKLGTNAGATKTNGYASDIVFEKDGYTVSAKFLNKNDDKTAAQNLYNLDSTDSFKQTLTNTLTANSSSLKEIVGIATAENKTEHVLVSVKGSKGTAYKVVTITSVPGVHNSVTKIEDATNNKVIYTPDMGVTIPELILKGNTTLKVTLAYSIDKNSTTADIKSSSLYNGDDALNQNIITRAKETPKTGETYNTFYLYPTTKGTQQVTVEPSGIISASDHSIIDNDKVTLELTYNANAASQKPSKITGVKLGNKKGAKVVVKFNKDNTSKNIKYYVQKKVGKKTSGKSVGSNRTILSVKKGKTVKVRVKAYYYDANGTKHVGKYSKWVTKKTDKK